MKTATPIIKSNAPLIFELSKLKDFASSDVKHLFGDNVHKASGKLKTLEYNGVLSSKKDLTPKKDRKLYTVIPNVLVILERYI